MVNVAVSSGYAAAVSSEYAAAFSWGVGRGGGF